MLERLSWKKIIIECLLLCLPALALSLFIGHFLLLLAISLLLGLVWHYYNMMKLSRWLWNDNNELPPEGSYSWEHLFYGIYRYVQHNRKRRKELNQQIAFFIQGAESLPDAVILINSGGFIFWCNRLSERLLGFRWPQDRGQHIANLIRHPEFSHYIKQKNFAESLTIKLNNNLDIEFRIMPYIKDQILISARDMTEINQLHSMRSRFFADVNHELRTPLTVLKGYSELLLEDDGLTHNKNVLTVMQQQVQRIDDLVTQLLMLSKIEASPKAILNTVVDVPAILVNIENSLLVLEKRTSKISFLVDKSLKVYGNESQLYSAFSNLINKANNHTPDDSNIQVYWQPVLDGAEFKVTDNGPGIAPEHLSHLTERFYRVNSARSRDSGGSGLGLAIVKHVLNHHNSRLNIESQLNKGTSFSFILPDVCMESKNTNH